MPNYTPNYRLIKPTDNEYFDIANDNSNMDIIDSEIKKVNSRLNEKVNIITPIMFGAIGDGINDDTESLEKMFNYSDNCTIVLEHLKTYTISRKITILKSHLRVIGNDCTIKYTNNNTVLQDMYSGITDDKDYGVMLMFRKDNIYIENMNFNANRENTYFIHNGDKYYGWREGLPDENIINIAKVGYITTTAIYTHLVSNIVIKKCSFDGFGVDVEVDGGWESENFINNVEICNCICKNGFRDKLVIYNATNVQIHDNQFINNQRKAIQLYRSVYNARIVNNDIYNDADKIIKWYPSWVYTHYDAELCGIAITNPGYADYDRIVDVRNNKIVTTKSAIVIRNFSEDIKIESNNIDATTGISISRGLTKLCSISGNIIKASENAIMLDLYKISNINSSEFIAQLEIEKNDFISKRGIYLHTSGSEKSQKSIIMTINNNIYNNSVKILVDANPNITDKFITINSNEFGDFRSISFINNLSSKRTFSKTIASESSLNAKYAKIIKFSTDIMSQRFVIKGSIMLSSGSEIGSTSFEINVRINYSDISQNLSLATGRIIDSDGEKIKILLVSTMNNGVRECYVYANSDIFSDNAITVDYAIYSEEGKFIIDNDMGWVTTIENGTQYEFI